MHKQKQERKIMKNLTVLQFLNALDSNYSMVENSNVISDSGVAVNGDDLFEFMHIEIDADEKTSAQVFQIENVSNYINKLGAL